VVVNSGLATRYGFMTRRRWIADEVSGTRASITGEHASHLSRVLRVQMGQEFDISAQGAIRHGRVVRIADNRVEFELGAEIPAAESANLTLLLSIFKFDRMEWAIEKCTELGAQRIVPLHAQRTDSHLASASVKRLERWRRIALQASEQSRRSVPPEICAPSKPKAAIASYSGLRIVLAESENDIHLGEVLPSDRADEVALAIGPEGGWTEDELKLFRDAGWTSASLGPTILRAETAAIAATAIVLSHVRSWSKSGR
jgi:16S rRNA (uracil1498-N3)-methyltransferase